MYTSDRCCDFVRRVVVLTTFLGAGVAMSAQTPSQSTGQSVAAVASAQPALNLQVPAVDTSSDLLFSSSAAEAAPTSEASLVPPVNFANMQYGGGQRRYGRPRYRGGNTNQDGSSKYTFFAGAGLSQPVGNTWHYYTPSYGFQVGGGRNFSKNFALTLNYDYDHMGLTGQTLNNQITLYNNDINYYCGLNATNAAACASNGVTFFSALDGNAHVWSFTLNPTYTFFQGEAVGAYAVVGVGFYHKVTNFLAPEQEEYCDPFYGICEAIEANAIIDHYTSNAPGFNGGFGLTYKFSRFSNERFYGEVRYVFVDNSHRAGVTVNSPVATTYAETNDFPANSNRTSYFPIKFGIRF